MDLEACLQQCQNVSSFITSTDGLMGMEVAAILKMIAIRLATKWRQPYSRKFG